MNKNNDHLTVPYGTTLQSITGNAFASGYKEERTMKKGITAVLAMTMMLAGCASGGSPSAAVSDSSHSSVIPASTLAPTSVPFTLKTSSDKHIAYVNNYVGMNCANVGYTSLNGDRRDQLGATTVLLEFVTSDGSYVGPDDEEDLQNYVVTAQNVAPNTEVHLTFDTQSDGTEYDNLVSYADLDEIDLAVKKVGESGNGPSLTEITQSPDKHTAYIRNYVGKNLAIVGYESLAGDYRDSYGAGTVELKCVSEDGSYIDYSDQDVLKQYVITGQNIAPNTELTYVFSKKSDGTEYDNLVSSQSIEFITLNVKALTGQITVKPAEETAAASQEEAEKVLSEAEKADSDLAENASDEAASMLDSAKDKLGSAISSITGIGKSAEEQYQSIYEDYSAKLKKRSPELVQEYNSEASANTNGLEGLAGICNEKIEELAEISNEGVEKMAEVYWEKSGDYDTYDKYAGDLYDVYMEESEKITDAYMSSAF